MRTRWASIAVLGASFTLSTAARAATLTVGSGLQYPTPCMAIAAAQPNDEIDIAAATYTDTCEITVAGLTLKGVGGRPKIDLTGMTPAQSKGIYIVTADNVRIENLELTGAQIDDGDGANGAGLRVTGQGLVVHGCYIHDNQDGVLAAPLVDGGTITIEYTELSHNGLGDGCDQGGCTHNVYVSKTATTRYDKTIFQFNWSHDLASDTADKGHLFKSRSRETDVLYNRITGETGHDSYEVDIPNGGLAIVVGNVIEKGSNPDNPTLLEWGEEGIDPGQQTQIYVANNTFVNDFTSGTFLDVASGGTLTAHDNIFVGPGTPSNTGSLSADNMSGMDPLFVDSATYDYHLTAGSPAIGKAVDPGMAGTFSLIPTFEYVQPLASVPRLTDHDLGAFEYGTIVTGAGADAGVSTGDGGGNDAGNSGQTDAGNIGQNDAGRDVVDAGPGALDDGGPSVAPSGATTSSKGCSCDAAGSRKDPLGAPLAGLALLLLMWVRRLARRDEDREARR